MLKMTSVLVWRCGGNVNSVYGRLSSLSRLWRPASYTLQSVIPAENTNRCFSCLSSKQHHLQLQKTPNGPLQLYDSRRNIQYNLFYLLVEILEGQFMYIKNVTDLDWWLIIVLCTVPYRVALACFLRIKAVEHRYKVKHIQEDLMPKYQREEMKIVSSTENMYLSTEEKKRLFITKMRQHQMRVNKEQGYNPWSTIMYSVIPLPFWIANSMALRSLCGANIVFLPNAVSGIVSPEMHTGGMLWFTDLTVPDPYHVLPILTSISFLIMFELQALQNVNYGAPVSEMNKANHRLMKGVEYLARSWCVFVVVLFWNCPAAMTWYWCCSGFIALFVRLLLTHPYVDRKLTPDNMHHLHDPHPYKTIWTNMRRRYNPQNWFLS